MSTCKTCQDNWPHDDRECPGCGAIAGTPLPISEAIDRASDAIYRAMTGLEPDRAARAARLGHCPPGPYVNPHRVGSKRFLIHQELLEERGGLDERKLATRVGISLEKLHDSARKTEGVQWRFNEFESRIYFLTRD